MVFLNMIEKPLQQPTNRIPIFAIELVVGFYANIVKPEIISYKP